MIISFLNCFVTSNHRSNSPENTPCGDVIRRKSNLILYCKFYDPNFVIQPTQFDVIMELLNISFKLTDVFRVAQSV